MNEARRRNASAGRREPEPVFHQKLDPAREFLRDVLVHRRRHLEAIGPATDRPDLARWQVDVLTRAIARLEMPRFDINPFV
jgi:hypothetical protein